MFSAKIDAKDCVIDDVRLACLTHDCDVMNANNGSDTSTDLDGKMAVKSNVGADRCIIFLSFSICKLLNIIKYFVLFVSFDKLNQVALYGKNIC